LALKPWRQNPSKTNASFFMPEIDMKPSLNSEFRKRELDRINDENNKLLRRLQSKRSNYDVAKWNKERQDKEKILKNICAYPHVLGDRHRSVPKRRLVNIKHNGNTTQVNFTKGFKIPKSANNMKSIGDDSAEDNLTNQSNQDALNRTNYEGTCYYLIPIGTSQYKPTVLSPKILKNIRPLRTEGKSISSKRILLFEKKTKIGKKDYLVEISRDKLHMFIIAFLIENPQYFTLQVPIKQAFKLLLD
jgi:hypothetical protein